MPTYCGRNLYKDCDAEHFVDNILCITDEREKRRAINSIASAERNLRGAGASASTLYSSEFRDYRYQSEAKREELRLQIVGELASKQRLPDDDKIKLGKGGAKPLTQPKQEKKAFYVIGPPASGKSSISNKIADIYGAYILDSDYAKRKLPEFYNQSGGASLVHEESDQLVFHYEKANLMQQCLQNGYNIVVPKIGHTINGIMTFRKALLHAGYAFYLISVDLDRFKATQRAYNRFKNSSRYVPLSLIFDAYANEPTLNYFRIQQKYSTEFDGFAQISTDVPLGSNYILLEEEKLPDLRTIFVGGE